MVAIGTRWWWWWATIASWGSAIGRGCLVQKGLVGCKKLIKGGGRDLIKVFST